jgi:glycyl-tRNA synthetase beta chain
VKGTSASDEKYTLVKELLDFIFERLRGYYAEQGFGSDQFDAVRAIEIETLIDFDRRLRAVAEFSRLPEAQALAAANKRIGNILRQAGDAVAGRVDAALLDTGAEAELHARIESVAHAIPPLVAQNMFTNTLRLLAGLRAPIDDFFEHVMVMADDPRKRGNRLAMLAQIRRMFLQVADISLLQNT